jgi:hypothetical protein
MSNVKLKLLYETYGHLITVHVRLFESVKYASINRQAMCVYVCACVCVHIHKQSHSLGHTIEHKCRKTTAKKRKQFINAKRTKNAFVCTHTFYSE